MRRRHREHRAEDDRPEGRQRDDRRPPTASHLPPTWWRRTATPRSSTTRTSRCFDVSVRVASWPRRGRRPAMETQVTPTHSPGGRRSSSSGGRRRGGWTRGSPCGAVGAGAEDLQGVAHVGEAVLGGDRLGPALDGRTLDLDGAAAAPADQVVVVARRSSAGRSPRRRRCAARRPRRRRRAPAACGRRWTGRPRSPRRPQHVVDLLGAAELVEARPAPRTPAVPLAWSGRCAGHRASGLSVLVIVAPVRGVPVAVVDVVDVVAVLDGDVPAARSVLVLVPFARSSCGRHRRRTGSNGWRRQPRTDGQRATPTAQSATKPASASSTMVGPGAVSA